MKAEEAQWQLDAQATAIRTVEGLPADVRVKYEGPWWDGIRKLSLIANGEKRLSSVERETAGFHQALKRDGENDG